MKRILLIEDNQENAEMTIRILTSSHYEIEHHLRGFSGAQAARKKRPDLILMDFDLSDIDGKTLTLLLNKQLGPNPPPIVAVTARAGASEMYLAEKFGCRGFISKPFLPNDLLKIIEEVLETATS